MNLTAYAPTGRILRTITCDDGDLALHMAILPEDTAWIAGIYPPRQYRIDLSTGEPAAVLLPARPSPAHVFDWTALEWVDPRTLGDLQAQQVAQIDAAFEAAAEALTAGYPAAERLTWGMQQAEALAWQANSAAPTPFLDGIAAARGIPPTDMRAKTLENVLAFTAASQAMIGRRQALRDAIYAATGPAGVTAIAWPAP